MPPTPAEAIVVDRNISVRMSLPLPTTSVGVTPGLLLARHIGFNLPVKWWLIEHEKSAMNQPAFSPTSLTELWQVEISIEFGNRLLNRWKRAKIYHHSGKFSPCQKTLFPGFSVSSSTMGIDIKLRKVFHYRLTLEIIWSEPWEVAGLTEENPGKKKRRTFFYDVDRFRRVHAETQHANGRFQKILGRVTGALSSIQGIFVMMSAPLIIIGMVFLIVYSLFLGPLVFLGLVATGLVGLTVVVERRLGSADNFSSYDFWKRTAAQVLGYSLAVGLVLFLLFLGKIPLPLIGP